MNKSTRTVIIIIGTLSILAGIYGFITNADSTATYSGIFIGIALIGSVIINQKGLDKS
ncbi:hypothetical protein [Maribacter sp. 1_MG-2023]|uniref:hypothetical protein n=1 Tax=Maribacter sp. 1_MG-2023 TaxID=3062677 RepID=UPI0026E1E53C|nr:hypothetical protein [Maribacter sp. 1_MG-2023]MDO6471316.1 hypothetical protein [Maribacter sp. 1_MG-2023]